MAAIPPNAPQAEVESRVAAAVLPEDPPAWAGDATVSGTAVEVDPARIEAIFGQAPPGPSHLFRADIVELTLVTLGDPADHLVLESWVAGRGTRRRTRT